MPPPSSVLVPFLDLRAQYETIRDEVRAAVDRVLESQRFVLGPEVEALEGELAAYCACARAVGVSSGTDALLASLMALGVGVGDEVVTTAYSFVATASAIARVGARPVLVDVDPGTYALDPRGVEAALTPRTKAVVPVHLYGQMADMEAITTLARARRVAVVEDAAQAIGAERGGRRAGSWGDLGCLSFFPSKNLGAFGDGGAIVTHDDALAGRAILLRSQGQARRNDSVVVGGNFRLDALQAAVLRVKLPHLETWTLARRRNAARYRALFDRADVSVDLADFRRGAPGVVLPTEVADGRHVYNQFVIRAARRDALRAHLAENGIASEVYYPRPLHLQACFSALGHRVGDFVESERAAAETLALPIYPELTESMQAMVVEAVARFVAA